MKQHLEESATETLSNVRVHGDAQRTSLLEDTGQHPLDAAEQRCLEDAATQASSDTEVQYMTVTVYGDVTTPRGRGGNNTMNKGCASSSAPALVLYNSTNNLENMFSKVAFSFDSKSDFQESSAKIRTACKQHL